MMNKKETISSSSSSSRPESLLTSSNGKLTIFDSSSSSSSSSSSLSSSSSVQSLISLAEEEEEEEEEETQKIKPIPQDASRRVNSVSSPLRKQRGSLNLLEEETKTEKEEESKKDIDKLKNLPPHALYLHIHSNAPQGVRHTIHHVCITDDDVLLKQILEDVGGIPFLLRHALFLEDSIMMKKTEEDNGVVTMTTTTTIMTTTTTGVKKKKGGMKRTVFWLACYCNSVKVLRVLLEECRRHFRNVSGGDVEKAERALSCLLDIETGFGSKAILIAAAKNNPKIISTLLSYNINPNTTNQLGITPAIIASSLNHVQVLQTLASSQQQQQQQKTDFNHHSTSYYSGNKLRSMSCVHAACIGGHVDTLIFLHGLKMSDDHDDDDGCNKNDFSVGGGAGSGEILVDFLGGDRLVDFTTHDGDGYSCVGLAALHNRNDAIKVLSSMIGSNSTKEPDLNQRFQHKTDNNHPLNGEPPITTAVRNDSNDAVLALLSSPHCDPLARNKFGMTALHVAAEKNKPKAAAQFVSCLEKERLELFDSEDKFGMTPLYIASVLGHHDVVDFLAPVSDMARLQRASFARWKNIGGGKDAAAATTTGGGGGGGGETTVSSGGGGGNFQPALLAATSNNHVEVMMALLAHGADVNQTDDAGRTAISIAAKRGYLWACKVLLENKADVNLRSKKGEKTPLQNAKKYKHFKVVELLEAYMKEREN